MRFTRRGNKVYVYDKHDTLRRRITIQDDGRMTYTEWTKKGVQMMEHDRVALPSLEE